MGTNVLEVFVRRAQALGDSHRALLCKRNRTGQAMFVWQSDAHAHPAEGGEKAYSDSRSGEPRQGTVAGDPRSIRLIPAMTRYLLQDATRPIRSGAMRTKSSSGSHSGRRPQGILPSWVHRGTLRLRLCLLRRIEETPALSAQGSVASRPQLRNTPV